MPVLFLAFWIILNARVTLEVIVIGIPVSILISFLSYRFIGLSFSVEKKIWARILPIIGYLFFLLVEVIKANVHMIALILSPKIQIKPQIIYFDSPLRSEALSVALANSITLTPGTITIKLEDGRFGVHAIDEAFGEGVESESFAFTKRLRRLERGSGIKENGGQVHD